MKAKMCKNLRALIYSDRNIAYEIASKLRGNKNKFISTNHGTFKQMR